MLYRLRYVIYAFIAILLLVSIALFSTFFMSRDGWVDVSRKGKKMNGVFSVYQGKVYALVPSNGYYELKNTTPANFRTFGNEYQNQHIGFTDQQVFAGNIVLKDLDPKRLRALGQNYYSDGSVTYYASSLSSNNESLSAIGFVFQLILEKFKISDKPQNYWYPFVKLPTNTSVFPKSAYGIAVSKTEVFFEGLLLPKANPKTIRAIMIKENGIVDRESTSYFTDEVNVYYQNQLLDIPYNPSVYEIRIRGDIASRNPYLIDEKNGLAYVGALAFNSKNAPYQILSSHLENANQVLFAAKSGIYYYDSQKDKIKKAGENPFEKNDFTEIAPDVFKSGNSIYFLSSSESRGSKTGLQSRNTQLNKIPNLEASSLKKISSDNLYDGSVWQSGDRYFYFSRYDNDRLKSSPVYEIFNKETAQKLALSTTMNRADLNGLLKTKQLQMFEDDELLDAETNYPKEDRNFIYYLLGGVLGLGLLGTFLLRNKKIAPFFFKNENLIINNLAFNKFQITEIEKVVFRVVKAARSQGGYHGLYQIIRKNGKSTRHFMFSSKISIFPESENQIKMYITELQDKLKKKNIRSEIARSF